MVSEKKKYYIQSRDSLPSKQTAYEHTPARNETRLLGDEQRMALKNVVLLTGNLHIYGVQKKEAIEKLLK